MFSFLTAKKKPLKERVREWKRNLKKEARTIDREIREIKRAEKKCIQNIRKLAKKVSWGQKHDQRHGETTGPNAQRDGTHAYDEGATKFCQLDDNTTICFDQNRRSDEE